MKVIQKNAGEMPKVIEIDGSLESMQKIVGGYIETFPLDGPIVIVLNEEGKLMNLPLNFRVQVSPSYIESIVGNAFFCRASIKDFESLTDDDIKYLMNLMSRNV